MRGSIRDYQRRRRLFLATAQLSGNYERSFTWTRMLYSIVVACLSVIWSCNHTHNIQCILFSSLPEIYKPKYAALRWCSVILLCRQACNWTVCTIRKTSWLLLSTSHTRKVAKQFKSCIFETMYDWQKGICILIKVTKCVCWNELHDIKVKMICCVYLLPQSMKYMYVFVWV